ncbi:hypothetical protein MT303_002819 [Vibrio parahaemolyticus]|nr:hypothetical protein [Vibrio parahaemolyticus]
MSKKRDTILWINHAISYFKSQGKTQKDMSNVLCIEESRISEMKTAKRLLSPSERQSIIDFCGAPRRESGRFEHALCFNSVDTFVASFDELMENRYLRELIRFFQDHENQANLLSKCIPIEDENGNYIETIRLSDIDEMIRDDDLEDTFQRYHHWLKNQNENSCLKMPVFNSSVLVEDKDVFHLIYQLWMLVKQCPTFLLATEESFNLNPVVDVEEVVITGEKVLLIENSSKPKPVNQPIIERFGDGRRYPNNKCIKHDLWQSIRCELYLSEDMNYHLLIHLSHEYQICSYPDTEKYGDGAVHMSELTWQTDVDENDLLVVIENINSLKLFSIIEDVRKWCGLPIDNHLELKRRIAKSGGYVPGARVLV